MLPVFIHPDRLDEEPLRSDVMAMNKRVGLEGCLRQQSANASRIDARPHLAEMRCPTLVVCGRQDILLPPEHSEELRPPASPAHGLSIFEGCALLPSMEPPPGHDGAVALLAVAGLSAALDLASRGVAGTMIEDS